MDTLYRCERDWHQAHFTDKETVAEQRHSPGILHPSAAQPPLPPSCPAVLRRSSQPGRIHSPQPRCTAVHSVCTKCLWISVDQPSSARAPGGGGRALQPECPSRRGLGWIQALGWRLLKQSRGGNTGWGWDTSSNLCSLACPRRERAQEGAGWAD